MKGLRKVNGFIAPDGALFIEALANASIFLAGKDERRTELRNVHWHYEPGTLTIVATDAYQLSIQELAIDAGAEKFTADISADQVALIVKSHKLGHSMQRPVQIKIEEGKLTVSSHVIDTVHPLAVEAFPDWQRIQMNVTEKATVWVETIGVTAHMLTRLGRLRVNGKQPTGFAFTLREGKGSMRHMIMHVHCGPTVIMIGNV